MNNNLTKLISINDDQGRYVKNVYSRYAVQMVIKGKAVWVMNNTAISLRKKVCPILRAFPQIGDTMTVPDAMNRLMGQFQNSARCRAAGALGGAARSGFITLQGNCWTRVKESR